MVIRFFHEECNLLALLVRNYQGLRRLRMLGAFFKIEFGYCLFLLGIRCTSAQLLGLSVHFFSYERYRSLFREIFVRKEYAFSGATKPVIIDCGGNIGMSVLFFKEQNPDAEILVFEPDPATFALLSRTITENKLAVQAEQAALTSTSKPVELLIPNHEKGSLGMTTMPAMILSHTPATKITVPGVMLSTFIDKPVDFLKIDVEGAELTILQDLAQHKKLEFIKAMVVEFHYNPGAPENSLSEFIHILESHKFSFVAESLHIMPPYENYKGKGFHMLIYAYR